MLFPKSLKSWSILISGLCCAAASGLDAAGNVARPKAPAALTGLPWESQAQVLLLEKRMMSELKAPPPGKTFPITRKALRAEPLNATALHLMAFSIDKTGNSPQAVKYAKLADAVTHRDFLSQLILINESARSNDFQGALQHYDAALRAHPASGPIVYPILKNALSSERTRIELSKYVTGRSPWALEFVSFAMNDEKSTRRIADVVLRAGSTMRKGDLAIIGPPLVTRLIEAKSFDLVPKLLKILPGANTAMLAKAEWTKASVDPTYGLAAWQVTSTATSSAAFVNLDDEDGPKLSVYTASGGREVAAKKYLALAPGTYSLRQMVSFDQSSVRNATASWRLICLSAENNPKIWQSQNMLGLRSSQRHTGMVVPASCTQQRLDLVVEVPFNDSGLDLSIGGFHVQKQTAP